MIGVDRPGGGAAHTASQVQDLLMHAAAYRAVNSIDYRLSGFLGRAMEAFEEAERDPLHDTCYRPETFYPVIRDLILADEEQLERCLCDCLRMAARCDIRRQGGGSVDGYSWEFLQEAAYAFTDIERFKGLLNIEKADDLVDSWLGTLERFKRQLTSQAVWSIQ